MNNALKAESEATPSIASPVQDYLHQLLDQFEALKDGDVASYIPELTKANPESFAISVTTADGKTYRSMKIR